MYYDLSVQEHFESGCSKSFTKYVNYLHLLLRCRKLITYFHKSHVDNDEFKKKRSMFLDVPKHKLIHDVTTRCNYTYDMVQWVCKQQLGVLS